MKYLFLLLLVSSVSYGKMPSKLALCKTCHGDKGLSLTETIPNLQGQKKTYLIEQLKNYKSNTRIGGYMNGIAAGLTDKEIEELSKYFSKQECK
jgi:cytochrome c553